MTNRQNTRALVGDLRYPRYQKAFGKTFQTPSQAAKIWSDQLAALNPDDINQIFNRLPEGRITEVSANFAKRLIEYNRTELLRLYQLELDSGR